jgi:putative tryptophan/tyrosine transport system substrate-binding protein
MKRRAFIMLLANAAGWPLAARAQPAKMPVIGILLTGNPEPDIFLKGFREALWETGYVVGENIRLEVRSAEGKIAALPERAAELVRLKVDVIVTSLTPPALAAKQATSDIPIVMAPAGDPVSTDLVASLARPGGNVTGVSAASVETAGKSLELIREVIPSARRVAVLADEADPFSKPFLEQIAEGAQTLGIEVEPVLTGLESPLEAVFQGFDNKQIDALIVQGGMLRKDIFDLAIRHRLPSFSSDRQIALAGGLMTYGASATEVQRAAAGYVDKILRGRRPADLPVALPSKFELTVNLNTAKAIGLKLSLPLLSRADEVIQ